MYVYSKLEKYIHQNFICSFESPYDLIWRDCTYISTPYEYGGSRVAWFQILGILRTSTSIENISCSTYMTTCLHLKSAMIYNNIEAYEIEWIDKLLAHIYVLIL